MKIDEIKEVSEIFGTPDELIKCASLLREAGYIGEGHIREGYINPRILVLPNIKEYIFTNNYLTINAKDLTL